MIVLVKTVSYKGIALVKERFSASLEVWQGLVLAALDDRHPTYYAALATTP